MTRTRKLKNLAYQSLAENDVNILEGYMEKERAEKKRKKKMQKEAKRKNRGK